MITRFLSLIIFCIPWVGRVLVGEGVLTKACRKKPKPRQFFLFNDLLVYGNIIINKKKYNKQHIIPLEEVIIPPRRPKFSFINSLLNMRERNIFQKKIISLGRCRGKTIFYLLLLNLYLINERKMVVKIMKINVKKLMKNIWIISNGIILEI